MKTWFITGTSRGFGREWAIAALDRGGSDNPPLRLFLGESPLRIAVEDDRSRRAAWAQGQQVAAAAQGIQG